jgi:hypothetical protein
MLQELKDSVDTRLLSIYDKPTITELFSFIVSQTSSSWKAQAEQGAHDDLVMALSIAWQLYQLVPKLQQNDDAEWEMLQHQNQQLLKSRGY